jgi:predicted regulator of Ras-like GTPase activity (Roadblock/LC7/MglB family)
MASEKTYLEAISRIEADVNGVIATAAVDMDSGMTLASKSNRADFDLTVASAYNSELVKQKLKIMQALHLKSTLEDMLLTLSDQIHLIKIFPGSKTFLYLAADKGSTNLAILRSAVARHCAGID